MIALHKPVRDPAFLLELRAMQEPERRKRLIAEMFGEELDGYAAEAKLRGVEPYETVAIAARRQKLLRMKA